MTKNKLELTITDSLISYGNLITFKLYPDRSKLHMFETLDYYLECELDKQEVKQLISKLQELESQMV